jgi:hypothetical protein
VVSVGKYTKVLFYALDAFLKKAGVHEKVVNKKNCISVKKSGVRVIEGSCQNDVITKMKARELRSCVN